MAVAKMKLVNIVGRVRDFDRVVRQCCINGNFHPERSAKALEDVQEFHPIDAVNPYEAALQKVVDIGVHADIGLRYSNFDHLDLSDDGLREHVQKMSIELDKLGAQVRELSQSAGRYEQMLEQLGRLQSLQVSLDDVFHCKYIAFRFGRLPKDSLPKIDKDHEGVELLFVPLEESDLFYWGFYVAKKSQLDAADEFFNSLYFERIPVIEEAHGLPAQARQTVERQLEEARAALEKAKRAVDNYWSANKETFLKVYSKLRYLSDSFNLRQYAWEMDGNFYVFGWVPEQEVPAFTKQFQAFSNVDCVIEGIDDAPEIEPPTALVNNGLVKPFEGYVKLYGLPKYGEIDPTPVTAVLYSLMFGIMFGDLGQGFIILLLALWMKLKKKWFLGDIMVRCSVFSMIFGLLYNSVFGFSGERAILPYSPVLPVENSSYVMTVLLTSVAGGVILILFCMVLNMVNGVRQGRPDKFLFGQNGIAGMVFYISILALLVGTMSGIKIGGPAYVILLFVVPLLLIGCKEPLGKLVRHEKKWAPTNIGEFILFGFFELFEIVLSFITNTISYIRVGAFILSHAAMMSAIFTIANMLGGASPVVLVFGNLFIIGLEGLVVGIQALRLQFYEVYSRFYEGGGKAYEPARIHY